MISPLAAFVIGLAIGAFVAGMLAVSWGQARIESLEADIRSLTRRRPMEAMRQDGSMRGANAPVDRRRGGSLVARDGGEG